MFCLLKAPEALNQYYKSTVVRPPSALLYACVINLTIYTWEPLGAFKIMLPTERGKRAITVKDLPVWAQETYTNKRADKGAEEQIRLSYRLILTVTLIAAICTVLSEITHTFLRYTAASRTSKLLRQTWRRWYTRQETHQKWGPHTHPHWALWQTVQ